MNTINIQAHLERLKELHAALQQVRFAIFGENADSAPPVASMSPERELFNSILEAEWQTMVASEQLEALQETTP